MRALPFSELPRFEAYLEALFTMPERCRHHARRFWIPAEGDWRSNPLRAACIRRSALAIGLGLYGLRSVEVLKLRVAHLGPETVFVRSAKGGHFRTVSLGRCWAAAAAEMVAGRREAELVFQSSRGTPMRYHDLLLDMYDLTRHIFGQRFSFHCLRHTAALRMYLGTRDVLAVQKMLGHRSLRSTWVYLQQITPVSFPNPPFSGQPNLRIFDGDPPAASAG